MELIRTKLEVPLSAESLLQRPRLLEQLHEVARVRITLVHAPAGYGKTSLLSQWHRAVASAGSGALWFSVDSADQSAINLLTYLSAGLCARWPALGKPPESQSAANFYGTSEPLAAFICNALDTIGEPVYFFFDDIHHLGPDAAKALYRLMERASARTRFILASRGRPDLQLARARARGELLEMDVEELRFTRQETADFMRDPALDSLALDQLDARTEGWIVGAKLIRLALRSGKSGNQLLNLFTGGRRSVSEFFAQEVLSSQNDELREFLLKTSVLSRLSPALCNAVTGRPDGRRMLTQIEESGLFLVQLDSEGVWSRYHHLFQEFLQRRLEEDHPELSVALHLRASQWFLDNGSPAEAIEHALCAGQSEQAATLLEGCCHDLSPTGQFRLVGDFIARIPAVTLQRFPRILLIHSWLLARNLRFEEARALLEMVRRHLGDDQASGNLCAEERGQLRYLLLHREMVLSSAEDDALAVERQCRQLLSDFPEQPNPYLRAMVYTQLLYAQREQYCLTDLERLRATIQGIIEQTQYSFTCISLQANLAPSLFFAGKSDEARLMLEHALAEAVRLSGPRSALAALPAMPLAEIEYENNNLERVGQLLEDNLEHVLEFGFVDQILAGYLTRARLCRALEDVDGALLWLDKAMAIAVERGLERLRHCVIEERVKLLLQSGKLDQAARYATEQGIGEAREDLLPRGALSLIREVRARVWVRIATSQDRSADALLCIKHWRSCCARAGAVRSEVVWGILLAQAYFIGGQQRAAQRALSDAIGLAAPSRLIRSFVDEGAPIKSLLSSTQQTLREALQRGDAFMADLLRAFEQHPEQDNRRGAAARLVEDAAGLYGKLSAREREILSLVGHGMRNREIASKIGMTEGSVKWYMQQIYDKVGTRRRLQAVERARRFGLIV